MVRDQAFVGTALVLVAAAGFGLNPLLAQLLYAEGLGPEVVTLYRFALPAALALPLLRPPRAEWPEAARMLVLGVANGVGVLCYFRALQTIPVSTAILVYYTYPVFSVLIGWLAFGRPPTRASLVAAALILVAVSLAVRPEALPVHSIVPLVLCFLAPLVFAAMIQYLARPAGPMPAGQRLTWALLGHVLVLAPLAVLSAPDAILPQSWSGVLAVFGLGLAAAAIPQYLFVVGAPMAGPERTAIAGAFELVLAMLTGAVMLGKSLDRLEITAMILIVIAMMVRHDGGGRKPQNDAQPPAHRAKKESAGATVSTAAAAIAAAEAAKIARPEHAEADAGAEAFILAGKVGGLAFAAPWGDAMDPARAAQRGEKAAQG